MSHRNPKASTGTLIKAILLFSFLLGLSVPLTGHAVTFKLASMAPKGTSWGDSLEQMAAEIKKQTKGEVVFKIFLGGVAGDEPNVLRQIRIGKFHGGMFTGIALGEINPDVRVMEVPFSFLKDREKAWGTLEKGKDLFNKGFTSHGFKNLGFFEIGLVYLVSTKELSSIDGLKGRKIWSWTGDLISSTLIDTMKLVGVPLGLQDVLSSLSTGMIDTAYASPMGILALQWQTKIKFLMDFPVTYSIGALVLGDKFWQQIPAKYRPVVEKICQEYTQKANMSILKENEEALASLKKSGIKFITFSEKDISQGKKIRQEVIEKLKGKLFGNDALDFLNKQI